MKKSILLSFCLCVLFSCGEKVDTEANEKTESVRTQPALIAKHLWEGNIRGDIPVKLEYQLVDDLLIGEMTYMNTKAKTPIKLVGTKEKDNALRFDEFDKIGNITGIIRGRIQGDTIKGDWFSPKTRDTYPLILAKEGIKREKPDLNVNRDEVFGHYRYQFGIKGYEGEFDIARVDDKQVAFALTAVTEAPARNIASIERDTVVMEGNNFIYMVPGTEDCGVKFSFYKDVLHVAYTNGYCNGIFGHNASVDGVFYKVK